jgi:SRSO17 transposase
MGQALHRSVAYDEDFYLWAHNQAALLRSGRIADADLANIAEELETLGRSEVHALRSHLKQIICHLLKLAHQPERATRSWINTVARARQDVEILLDENPSLRSRLSDIFEKAWRDGRALAILETGLSENVFQQAQEFTLDEVRSTAFLPPSHGARTLSEPAQQALEDREWVDAPRVDRELI